MIKAEYRRKLQKKVILITGGTGSFGNSVVNKLLECSPKRIIIFSRDEKKQFDMRNSFDNPLLKFIIGDVRDMESIYKASENVDYIFHAAALKQVPTCEFFPMEAVRTNVIGTQNVIRAAIEQKVKKVVVLSTDKAVYPINVIGLTKALMEKVMIAESKNLIDSGKKDTQLCGVRYGNVLYTRGSVIPYFVNEIKKGKTLNVTNLKMTRFLLPLIDAVDLVLFALISGENGYMYVRKSPSCTLETLAKSLCQIFGHEKGYKEVGIRAGEKMHETLVTQEEFLRVIDEKKYYKIPPESQGLDYNKYFFRGMKKNIAKFTSFTSENTRILQIRDVKDLLLTLPEMQREMNLPR